jgi:hypothetical protein
MGFQQTVSLAQGFGVQGEIIYDGPVRAAPWQLISTPQANVVGATAYTVTSEGIAQAGGVGVFAGILVSPKEYTYAGAIGTPTLTLPDDTIATLLTMGQITVKLTTAAAIGDQIVYNTTTGALASVATTYSVTGSFATNVFTVTATAGVLTEGSIIEGVAGFPNLRVVEQLTGTEGSTGTYQVSEQVGTLASATYTVQGGAPATGYQVVPNAKVILRASAANGLAIVSLTNP